MLCKRARPRAPKASPISLRTQACGTDSFSVHRFLGRLPRTRRLLIPVWVDAVELNHRSQIGVPLPHLGPIAPALLFLRD